MSFVLPFLTLALTLLGVAIAHRIVFAFLAKHAATNRTYALLLNIRSSSRATLLLLVILMEHPALPLSDGVKAALERLLDLGLIGCTAWMVIELFKGVEASLSLRYRIDVADNLLARQMRTRIQVLHHIVVVAVVLLSISVALMTFPNVRSLGASLLASAGLAGLVVGMAARPALSNLLAGIQIALTEPIRIDDVVVVENEWGRIEEIHPTYIVVRIWDLRRLILPLSYFIEHPFQNWTRKSADILGAVTWRVDYRLPLAPVREELNRILKSSPLWKGTVSVLQVTEAGEQTLELRALMDSVDSGKSWDLRCLVREQMIAFIQREFPDCLPRVRLDPPSAFATPALPQTKI